MMKVFVDTSAILALLDADDQHHSQAQAILERLRDSVELVTTNYIQVEAVAVVRRRLGAGATADLLDSVLPLMRVVWVDQQTHAVAMAAHRLSGAVSLVDRVSFAVMRAEGIYAAFAFDHDFEADGFSLLGAHADDDRPRQIHDAAATYVSDVSPELVSVTEIASRSSKSINTVQSWRRRHADFPTPVVRLAAGPIWNWPTVAAWLAGHTRAATHESAEV